MAMAAIVAGALALSACGSNETVRKQDIQSRTQLAAEFIRHGNIRAGAAVLKALSEDHPQRVELMQTMGELHFEQNNNLAALNQFQVANKIRPTVRSWTGIGKIYLRRNDSRLAEEAFDAALSLKSGDPDALNGKAVAYDLEGRHEEAVAIYEEILRSHPQRLDIWNNYALSLAFNGQTVKSKEILEELYSVDEHRARTRQNLALVYMMEKNWRKAREIAAADLDQSTVGNNIAFFRYASGY